MALPLDSTIFEFSYSKKETFTLCDKVNVSFLQYEISWHSNRQYLDPEYMGRLANPVGDLLDDLLVACAGILRSISFTMYKTGD